MPRVQFISKVTWWVSARCFQAAFLLLGCWAPGCGRLPFPSGGSASAQLVLTRQAPEQTQVRGLPQPKGTRGLHLDEAGQSEMLSWSIKVAVFGDLSVEVQGCPRAGLQ